MTDSTCTPDDCNNRGPRGGLCHECNKAKALRRYYERPEEYAANNKRWREENPERNRERIRRWFEDNGERRRAYLDEHRDEANVKRREWRAAHPGWDTEYQRRWREANPEKFALKNRENSRRRQIGTTASRVAYETVLERDGMVCHLCGGDIPSLADLHFDHVIPLSEGGPHTAENIRPAHALCNLRKSDKII